MVQVMLVRDGLCERHDDSLTCRHVYPIFSTLIIINSRTLWNVPS